jgi:hypothetical protein
MVHVVPWLNTDVEKGEVGFGSAFVRRAKASATVTVLKVNMIDS